MLDCRILLGFLLAAAPVHGGGTALLDRQFEQTVRPFVKQYCVSCHSGQGAAAQLNLGKVTSAEMAAKDFAHWEAVKERLEAKTMPPKPIGAPPETETRAVLAWIRLLRAQEMKKTAGDPGAVLARRLSNAEYNYTVRDLTGQDMQVTKEFPVDPANTAGFDNSGESLAMSPGLLNKYLQAARRVADHAVLKPDGMEFAPYPMLAETDREKYAIERILQFYKRQPTDFADYFEAAWRYRYRVALGHAGATLRSSAAAGKVSGPYLAMVWQILHEPGAVGPVLTLQKMWQALPVPEGKWQSGAQGMQQGPVRAQCVAMRDFAVKIRAHTAMQFAAPKVRGLPPQSQPLLNWKLRQFALHRRESDPEDLVNAGEPAPKVPEIPKYPGLHQEAAPRWAALSAKARAGDRDLVVPGGERARYQAAFAQFANVFPDAFYITERGRYFPDDSADKGRLLSAGYHSVVGFFRDDRPLMELILDEKGRRELDRLWNEFDYIAHATERTWTQYFFNQSGEVQGKGAEAGTARPVGMEITDARVILEMREAYEAKAKASPDNDPVAVTAIREHFDHMNRTLRDLEKQKSAAEPRHLDALLRFGGRAYRRPLTAAEREDLLGYYREMRGKKELSHEDAIRQCLVSVLMAPDFLYRFDLDETSAAGKPLVRAVRFEQGGGGGSRPLSNYALASRLSYFLWSSMPDEELLAHAAAGDLARRDVLLKQAHRMVKDARVRGLATEFTGNWLEFRHFETNNSVDRERFPAFNNELREAMFEEPVRYVEDVVVRDRSVLDLLYGRDTFVNAALAKHYGMPERKGTSAEWVRVEDANRYGRGGLLPMAVFLTQNSPGLRTSPVKRGHWVVQRVLGEVIPPPPPTVPELPSDEAKADRPVREMLAQHRDNPACAGCHARFDSFGLAFEGYGPVGNARTRDLAGRPVDTLVTYPGGMEASGLTGLQAFIRQDREKGFVENLCRKLLAYGLNRSLQLSDEAVVERMEARLAAQNYRFGALIDSLVTSPQFLNRRVGERRGDTGGTGAERMLKGE